MGARSYFILMLLLTGASSWATEAADSADGTERELLADKLSKVSKLDSMLESKYPESMRGGADYNRNDGTPFTANTTYHKHVWDECQEWVGGQYCNRWLDAYVSEHGFKQGAGSSPLESLVAIEWRKMQKVDKGSNYRIWNIQRDGGGQGSNLDVDGKLDRNNITAWNLNGGVRNRIDKLGYDYADSQVQLTYDEGAPKNTMPNIETMRLMASRYTKIFRNNLLATLGELRAASKPIEFSLGEDLPNCDAYRNALKTEMEETRIEERIQRQARLDPETRTADLKQRYQDCVQLRNASYAMVNAEIKNGKARAGDPDQEQYDKMAARINIALIDRTGLNPNALPKPQNVAFKKSQYATTMQDHQYGGGVKGTVTMTNAEQLVSYNQLLEDASAGMRGAAARAGGTIAVTDPTQFKIGIGTTNMVKLNSLTNEMRQHLGSTALANTAVMAKNGPEQQQESAPSQLTMRSKQ